MSSKNFEHYKSILRTIYVGMLSVNQIYKAVNGGIKKLGVWSDFTILHRREMENAGYNPHQQQNHL